MATQVTPCPQLRLSSWLRGLSRRGSTRSKAPVASWCPPLGSGHPCLGLAVDVHPGTRLRLAVWAAQAHGDRTLVQKKQMPRPVASTGHDVPPERGPVESLPLGRSLLSLRTEEQPERAAWRPGLLASQPPSALVLSSWAV